MLSETLQTLEKGKEKDEQTLKDLRTEISSTESLETARLIAAKLAAASAQYASKQSDGRASRFDLDGDDSRLQPIDGRVPASPYIVGDIVARANENALRRARVVNPCEDLKKGIVQK